MKRIVLCADDYGLAPGVSQAIRELIALGRLNATSAMTVFPDLAEEAKRLAVTPSPAPVQIGLHVTLSGGFKPLVSAPMPTRDGMLPPMAVLYSPLSRFRIVRAAVAAEVEAQIEAFKRAFGRAPDYIDGHHHVQLLPGVRKPLLETVAKLAPKAWVRQCAPLQKSKLLRADNKTRLIGALSIAFAKLAGRHGIKTNPSFSGAYNYGGTDSFAGLFARFVAEITDGGVIMCHPGHIDDVLRSRDILIERRQEEYSLLASEQFHVAMKEAGATLAGEAGTS
ncbi:MAG: ChbG/HpnK family deacetylase [Xanthobacteraceae bacterium]|nr:ChbG/HpnK family deacetylase [Xanthobacteraceae bacterium]QYK45495.1 MAG: ChbG/HpnK family deacetylase [Xanthobacteraceae bacterium]